MMAVTKAQIVDCEDDIIYLRKELPTLLRLIKEERATSGGHLHHDNRDHWMTLRLNANAVIRDLQMAVNAIDGV